MTPWRSTALTVPPGERVREEGPCARPAVFEVHGTSGQFRYRRADVVGCRWGASGVDRLVFGRPEPRSTPRVRGHFVALSFEDRES